MLLAEWRVQPHRENLATHLGPSLLQDQRKIRHIHCENINTGVQKDEPLRNGHGWADLPFHQGVGGKQWLDASEPASILMHIPFRAILQGEHNIICHVDVRGHGTHQQSPTGSPLTSLQNHLSSTGGVPDGWTPTGDSHSVERKTAWRNTHASCRLSEADAPKANSNFSGRPPPEPWEEKVT